MISLKHITFGYTDKLIFDDLSVTLDHSWKLALVGRNGRGKTTLMKILLEELDYSGKLYLDKSCVYFPQEIRDKSQLTKHILDDLYDAEEWQIQRELNLLGLPETILWRPFETLSGGEQTKVRLAGLFLNDAHFPLIDEPTNHLDHASRQQIATYLQNKKTGYIVSSHDRKFLDLVSDHLLAIERNTITLLATTYSEYAVQKTLRDQFEWSQNTKRKSEISRLKQTAKEKADWSENREKEKSGNPKQRGSGAVLDKGFIGARAARQMKKSKGLSQRMAKAIKDKEQLLKNLEKVDPLWLSYHATHHKVLVDESQLMLSIASQPLFKPINLQLHAGEILAITGPNGSGKSEVLKHIKYIAEKRGLHVSYLAQLYDDMQGSLRSFCQKHHLDETALLSNLRKLGMERHVFKQNIEEMSLGQQKKVALAKSLSESAELYIWDEPLNYLDIDTQKQIERVLKQVKPAMIIVEHDEMFIGAVADQIIELSSLKKDEIK